MRLDFDYLVRAIPPELYTKTKATICRHIAIFEPEEYAVGEVLCVDDYHFVLFLSSAPATKVGDVLYRVKKGDMLVIQPWDEVYGEPGEAKVHGKYLHIAVKKEFFAEVAAEIAGEGGFSFKRIQGHYSSQLLNLIGEFQLELMSYGEAYPQMIRSISTQIVFQLIRDIHAEQEKNSRTISRDNQYISKAISFMLENYQTSISINDICSLIYLSPCHFKRVFKEETGRSPHQYLMDIRLEKARELLGRKENSIEDVANQCGFVNAGHFAVAFKRSVKLSPSEFRKIYAGR